MQIVRRAKASGSLRRAVRSEIRAKRATGGRPLQLIRTLIDPDWKALVIITALFISSIPVSWLLAREWPQALTLLTSPSLLTSVYVAMWQVEAGLAAVALPILLFIIELSKDRRQIAIHTHEVLIKETGIFFIILFALAGTARISCDISWFQRDSVFVLDLVSVFFLTLVLTIIAYYRAIQMLFSPSKLKSHAIRVAKEKMNASLDSSIEVRIASNHLARKLEALNVDAFRPLGYSKDKDQYITLKARTAGTVADIDMNLLEEFIHQLPWKVPHPFQLTQLALPLAPEVQERPRKGDVWFTVRYLQTLRPEEPEVILLRKDACVPELINQAALEKQLMKIVKVKPNDGN